MTKHTLAQMVEAVEQAGSMVLNPPTVASIDAAIDTLRRLDVSNAKNVERVAKVIRETFAYPGGYEDDARAILWAIVDGE